MRLFRPITLAALVAVAALVPSRGARADAADVPEPPRLPSNLLLVSPLEGGRLVLVAEKASQTLLVYRFEDHEPDLVAVWPCTTGKIAGDKQVEGDLRTPEGVYWFTRYIPDAALPPLYGAGALVMDYPNDFDRADGKTGSGIWMHGVESDERAYVANDTRGCVALRNGDFDRVAAEIRRHLHDTPIVVVEEIAWSDTATLARQARAVVSFLESWRRSWEAADLSAYLDHYASDFRADGLDLDGWAARKGELFRRQSLIRVALDDLVLLREKDRLWARFRQEYVSDGLRDVGRKELHLRADDAEGTSWHIVGEGWRPLDEGFELLDPASLAGPVTVAQVAAVAPDAAPPATSPAPADEVPSAFAAALQPTIETALEPEPTVESAAPPEAPAPAPEQQETAPAAEPTVESAPPSGEPATGAAPVVETSPTTVVETAAPEAAVPAAAEVALALTCRELAPESDRGWYQLIGPYARQRGDGVEVQVQLLNLRPTSWREGRWQVEATLPDGRTLASPADAQGQPFRTRQGEILTMTLPAPSAPGVVPLVVTVRDDDGRVALRQSLVLEASSRP